MLRYVGQDSLQLQVTVLGDQLERAAREKAAEVRRLEEALTTERAARAAADLKAGEVKTEAAGLKLKCARLERDLAELRNTTPKLARPTQLPRSPTPVSSPDDVSPTSKRGVVFSEDENEASADMDTSLISLSGRSTRGLKKILGKIKRSNSGGFEAERGVGEAFQRGGLRATTSGRLGGWQQIPHRNKRFSDWSVDVLCSWLETIGLGQYCGEVQRHIGTGADLIK